MLHRQQALAIRARNMTPNYDVHQDSQISMQLERTCHPGFPPYTSNGQASHDPPNPGSLPGAMLIMIVPHGQPRDPSPATTDIVRRGPQGTRGGRRMTP